MIALPSPGVGLPRALAEAHEKFFGARWPPWVGGLVVGFLNVLMFAYERPWSSSDGLRNWGDWMVRPLGLSSQEILAPWVYSGSVVNLGVLVGAAAAALLAGKFALRLPSKRELRDGCAGGILMGIGAVLAMGCNVGGFFSSLSAFSLSGVGMWIGLMIGSYLGLRYLVWEEGRCPPPPPGDSSQGDKPFQGYVGMGLLFVSFLIPFFYDAYGYAQRGGLFLFGALLGLVCQRSRLCFVSCFREPFRTSNGEMAKAVILALLASVTGFAVLKWTLAKPPDVFVFPSFWLGSVAGGVIFGVGMVLAGGCGTSSLWRAGEGQVKLWVALLSFALAGSLFRMLLEETGLIAGLGQAIFLPDVVGWKLALVGLFSLLVAWYLLVIWNEATGRLAMARGDKAVEVCP